MHLLNSRPLFQLLLLLMAAGLLRAQQPQMAELTTVPSILALNAYDAGANPRPVKLSGTVLGVNTAQTQFTLHDGVQAIGVELTQPFFQLKLGDRVEILGQTITASFVSAAHARVRAASIRVAGQAELPQALALDLPILTSFTRFDQWVSTEGFVMDWEHANGEMTMRVVANGGYFVAMVRLPDASAIPAKLNGARIRLTGINAGNRTTENAFFVPSAAQMQVLEEGTADVFDAPSATVPDLMQRKVEAGRRYRVRGVVAAVTEERKIMLVTPDGDMMAYLLIRRDQDVPGTLYSTAGNWPPPRPGDLVELVGSIFETTNSSMNASGLNWCQLRKLGTQPVPPPRAVDIETLLSWRNHDEWCSVEGVVTGWMQGATTRLYSIMDAHGWAIVQVRDVVGESFPKDLHGARLRFTGISRSRVANPGEALVVAGSSFIQVIKPGSADPFAVPQVKMQDLLKQNAPSADRVRVRGIVTGSTDFSVLYLRDESSALCVHLQSPWARGSGTYYADAGPLPSPQPGDEVEVMGSPVQLRAGFEAYGFDLYQTHVRILGKSNPPAPVPATLEEIAAGAHTSDLVETRGRIVTLQQQPFRNEWRTTFLLEADSGERIPLVHQGSQLTSFSQMHADHDVLVRAFVDRATVSTPRQLWTADEREIRVLGVSSIVLTRKLWMYIGGFIAVVAMFSGWVVALRKSNRATAAANAKLEKRVEERTTELEKAHADLQRALDQERELGELKSRFVTMVSHEFRTPLGIIMSAVELLQHYSDRLPEEEKKLQLHEIQSSTKHMGGLMEQVLLLGRAEAGKLSCKPQVLDLTAFAERIIDETQSISSRKCPITLHTEGDLSGAHADEALLRHILSNLISNAVKYSPIGAEVLVKIQREGPNTAIAIIDHGIGIPEKDRARLFEAFHRCSNVGEIPGTGLGLVIVKRCTDLHLGTLDIDSTLGQGTTFTVRLPLFAE
jgi:signal transduction histidine kinase